MKKIITAIILLTVSLSLCLPVSALRLSPLSNEEYVDYLEEETGRISRKVQYVMNEFIASDNPSEILSDLVSEYRTIPEYEIVIQENYDEDYINIFGETTHYSFESDYDSCTSETLSTDGITIQTVSMVYGGTFRYATNTVVIESEAFDILSDEVKSFINMFIDKEECYLHIALTEYKKIWDENAHQWFEVLYQGEEPDWMQKYGFHLPLCDVTSGSSVLSVTSNGNEIFLITEYLDQFAYYRFGDDYENYAHDYIVKLNYSDPEDDSVSRARDYKLESITFYASGIGDFYADTNETSPQTGDGIMTAALAGSAAAIAALAVYLRRKMR